MDSPMKMTATKKILMAMLVALSLTGCSSVQKPADSLVCPSVGLLPRADNITVRKDASAGFESANLAAKASFGAYRGACRKDPKGGIEYTLQFDIMVYRAPGNTASTQELPYFIGVVDANDGIVQRDGFVTKIEYNTKGVGKTSDTHTIKVAADEATAPKYKIIAGFILTPDEFEYNHDRSSNLKSKESMLNVR